MSLANMVVGYSAYSMQFMRILLGSKFFDLNSSIYTSYRLNPPPTQPSRKQVLRSSRRMLLGMFEVIQNQLKDQAVNEVVPSSLKLKFEFKFSHSKFSYVTFVLSLKTTFSVVTRQGISNKIPVQVQLIGLFRRKFKIFSNRKKCYIYCCVFNFRLTVFRTRITRVFRAAVRFQIHAS